MKELNKVNMKPITKNKTEKILAKISSCDSFDENDIEKLFINLRPYPFGKKIFLEVANFIAHNDERDRGITTRSLEAFYLFQKYFHECSAEGKAYDIKSPFPPYIKKLMKHQIDKFDEAVLKKLFNVTKEKLKSKIDDTFVENHNKQMVIKKNTTLPDNIFEAINHVLFFMIIEPAFDQDQVVSELIEVIQANKINVNADEILKYSDKIAVCIMLLLHKTTFRYSGKKGYCELSCKKTSILVDKNGNPINPSEKFGNLNVVGYVAGDASWIEGVGEKMSYGYCIMETNILVEDWCDSGMFVINPVEGNQTNSLCKKLILDQHLCLTSNGKIGVIDI